MPGLWGRASERLMEPHCAHPCAGPPEATQESGLPSSRACAPPACCCREVALPSPHPVRGLCGRGLVCSLRRCECTPAAFPGGERWGRALLTPPASVHANSDAHGCFASTHVTLGAPISQRHGAAPGQQLSNQSSATRAPRGGGTQGREGPGQSAAAAVGSERDQSKPRPAAALNT